MYVLAASIIGYFSYPMGEWRLNSFKHRLIWRKDILLKKQTIACFAGHMHEHYGYEMIKGKVSLNAGFGKYAQTLIEVQNGKIKKITKSKKCKPFKY